MHDRNSLTVPLLYLDRDEKFRISDDGAQWIIEIRNEHGIYVAPEPDADSYPLCGGTRRELINAVRENGLPTCVASRMILAVFWWDYSDYRENLSRYGQSRMMRDLNSLSKYAEPIEEELVLSREELRVRRLRSRQLASRDDTTGHTLLCDTPDAPLH